jgi:NADH-quinone oxidoreductase subunit M
MPELLLPWLELAILIPLLGSLWIGRLKDSDKARQRSIIVCSAISACTIGEWIDFESLGTFEAHDHWDVLEFIFHKDIFVIDELSAPLLPLAALLYLVMVLSTLRTKVNRFSFGWTLASEAILLATLSCREPWVLIALLSLVTIPPWIEMRARKRSTRVYTAHMGLFIALLVVGWSLVERSPDGTVSILPGALLTAAALLRSGIVPVHCWMTDLFEKVTFGTALLFVTPMTGAYVIMRLVLPVAPDWALQSIAIVSLITSVYAAGMALMQTEARRFFCYLFLSHSSLVLVGMELVTPIGMTGALCVWISVGLSLGGFGLTLRSIESRTGRLSMADYHGLYEHTPALAGLFLLTELASIGFPGTIGFIGTELLVEGAVEIYPLIGTTVVIAAALNGIAIMQAYFRIFTGTKHTASVSLKVRPAERVAVLILTALILGGGLFPQPGVTSRFHAATALIQRREERTKKQRNSGDENQHSTKFAKKSALNQTTNALAQ